MKYSGMALKNVRKKLGLTQERFGEKLGTKKQFISDLETESKPITYRTVLLLRDRFNVNPEYLHTGEGDMFLIDITFKEELSQEEIELLNQNISDIEPTDENIKKLSDALKKSNIRFSDEETSITFIQSLFAEKEKTINRPFDNVKLLEPLTDDEYDFLKNLNELKKAGIKPEDTKKLIKILKKTNMKVQSLAEYKNELKETQKKEAAEEMRQLIKEQFDYTDNELNTLESLLANKEVLMLLAKALKSDPVAQETLKKIIDNT